MMYKGYNIHISICYGPEPLKDDREVKLFQYEIKHRPTKVLYRGPFVRSVDEAHDTAKDLIDNYLLKGKLNHNWHQGDEAMESTW